MTALVIIGCGGFGREVFGIAEACRRAGQEIDIVGFLDDQPSDRNLQALGQLGAVYLGMVTPPARECSYVVAVGSPDVRKRLVGHLGEEAQFGTLVHPDSTIGPGVSLGPGSVVAPGVRLSTNISVGSHVHLDQNATVGHDAVIGSFARLNPMACVSGAVTVGEGALIGANATVLQGLNVGPSAIVGAGAVVTRDVSPGSTVRGVPAR